MDNSTGIFGVIEHPEQFATEEIERLLNDPANRELYNMLSIISSAMQTNPSVDINREWEQFKKLNLKPKRPARTINILGKRAAAFPLYVVTALGVAALGIGITFNFFEPNKSNKPEKISADNKEFQSISPNPLTEEMAENNQIVFENKTFEEIASVISQEYHIDILFQSSELKEIRMFYTLDTEKTLDEIINDLNTFSQINIRREGDKLIVTD